MKPRPRDFNAEGSNIELIGNSLQPRTVCASLKLRIPLTIVVYNNNSTFCFLYFSFLPLHFCFAVREMTREQKANIQVQWNTSLEVLRFCKRVSSKGRCHVLLRPILVYWMKLRSHKRILSPYKKTFSSSVCHHLVRTRFLKRLKSHGRDRW